MEHEDRGLTRESRLLLDQAFSGNLDRSLRIMKGILENDDTIVFREFESIADKRMRFCCIFADGMVDSKMIGDNLIMPLSWFHLPGHADAPTASLLQTAVTLNESKEIRKASEAVEAVLYGDTVVLAEDFEGAMVFNTKGWSTRSISEPDSEKALRGPRDGFVESLMTNTALIRLRLQTSELKFCFDSTGERSNTKYCICYMETLVDDNLLEEVKRRLKKIDIDGVLESNYIEELIRDQPASPFQTVGGTEKPDIVASKLLEGRIAIIVDGTPEVLTIPFLFVENLQAADDYYLNPYMASFGRLLRVFGFLLSIVIPALYVSLVCFHREMIPSSLLLNISAATQGVPMTTSIECILMLLMFEILRETGVRMPNKIGQALSIVGALVLGQAAVEAKIVSAPTVIVVAFTGITGLMIPKLSMALVLSRFFTLLLSSFLGLYGMFFALLALLIHLLTLESFGVPYLQGFGASRYQGLKDIYIRGPFQNMRTRPFFQKKDKTRMGNG